MSDTRARVREALLQRAGEPISGEELAAELGVSRVAIGKHVSALRADGAVIEASAGAGYRLDASRSMLPELVRRELMIATGADLVGGGPTASTMDDARARAAQGAAEGTVVLASEQTAGRGRRGRSWASPPGGAYLTYLARPDLALADVVSAPLAISLGIATALERLGVSSRLKWPNDIQTPDGRKLAGILMEIEAEADAVSWLTVGVGMNVFPDVPAEGAAYLADSVPGISVASAAAAVIDGIALAMARLAANGFGAMRGDYEARMAWRGHEVVLRDADGSERARGSLSGVDGDGRLVVEGEAGGVFSAGDLSLRERLT